MADEITTSPLDQTELQNASPVPTQPLPQDKLEVTEYQPVFPSKPSDTPSEAQLHYPSGSLGLLGDFINEGVTARIQRYLYKTHMGAYDPSFALTEDKLKEYTDGIPPSLWPSFHDANSEYDMRVRREFLLAHVAAQDRMSKAGFGSRFGLGLATGLTDPSTIALAFATGGAGELAGLGEFATATGRLGSMVRSGLVAGLTNAEAEAIVSSEYGNPTVGDLFHAAAGGAILGAMHGVFFYDPVQNAALRAMRKSVELQDIAATGKSIPETLTTKGQDYFKNELDPATVATQKAALVDHEVPDAQETIPAKASEEVRTSPEAAQASAANTPPPEASSPVSGMGAASPGGAVEQMPLPDGWKPGDPDYRNVTDAKGTRPLGLPRPSMVGSLVDSESGNIRRAARMTAEEVIPGTDGQPVIDSGVEHAERTHAARMTSYFEQVTPILQEWMRSNDPGFFRRARARERFFSEVYRAGLGEQTSDPLVKRAAEVGSSTYGDALGAGKRYAVPGLESIDHADDYRHIRWSKENIERMTERFGAKAVEDAMTGAVLPLSDKFTPNLANRIAVGMLKSISKTGEVSELTRSLALATGESEYLAAVLREGGVSESMIADIQNKLAPVEQSKISPAKQRTRMNHLYEVNATDKQTGQPAKLRLTDLMDTNEPAVLERYSRQIEGAGSMQAVLRAFAKSKNDVIPNAQALAERLRVEAIGQGVDPSDAASQTSKLMTLWKYMQGIPLNEPSKMGDFLLTTRKLQNAVRMGLAQFSHINNLAGAIGDTGFREMIRQVPAMKELWARGADGKLSNDLLREHIALTGSGSDRLRTEILSRLPNEDSQFEPTQKNVNNGLDRLNRAQADISGFSAIMQGIQRIAVLLNAQHWGTLAKEGGVIGERRLGTMGLTPAQADAIMGEIKTHAEYGDAGSLKAMNLSEWDPQTRADYIVALDKWSRRVAQTSSVGQMSQWMTTEWGKSLIQLRSYHIAAYEKQLLHGLYTKDRQVFMNWSLTSLMGTAAYIARESVSSVGRSDRKEYLDKAFAPDMLAKAAIARSGYLSLFPMGVDAVGRYTGAYTPQFSGTRSTGLESDPIFGSPTVDAISKARFLPKALIDGMRTDRKFSQEDMKTIRAFTPWQNALGLKNALDAIQSNLPYSAGTGN